MFLLALCLAKALVLKSGEKPLPTPWALSNSVQHSLLTDAQRDQKCLAFDCIRSDEGNDTARFSNTFELYLHTEANFRYPWIFEQTTQAFGA